MYVITGATGNTGSVVANTLIDQGQQVRVIGRSAERARSLTMRGAELFACDMADAGALTRAFTGAQGVYAMIPPDMRSDDYHGEQERMSNAIVSALRDAGVKYAVALSSFGADKSDGTGPVAGLRSLEEKLNAIPDLNALYLRAGYFMENLLPQISVIRTMDFVAGPLRGDLKVPMIATRDIGAYAAERLRLLDFSSKQTRELLGQRDISMNEAASIIGTALGKPDLKYLQLPDQQLRPALMQMGMSADTTRLLLEMAAALNSGHMRPLEPRSESNTTPTSFEEFVSEVFVPAYQGKLQAA